MVKPPLSRPWLVAASCVALGLVGGVACDERPARPAGYRAGYRVLEADLHTHTSWSDGSLSPFGVVRQADRRAIDVVAVTEHNTVWPSRFARAYASATNGPLAITGEEVTNARFHVIAIGVEQPIDPSQPLESVLADIHAQHGIAIAAHPVRHFWPALLPVRAQFDAAEVNHPIAYGSGPSEWRWSDMVKFYDESPRPLAAIGSSDYHWMSVLGLCRTLVFVNEPVTQDAVVDAIRERRTVTIDHLGVAHGNPELIGALAKEPYVPRTADYAYRGSGWSDRILRSLGWLGVVGVILLRARKRPSSLALPARER
jgi:predicted metal-dependent phosphoesterase TrpH